jgi:hypothetical protein
MIGPGGLLLVVPHVCAVPVSVLLAGLPKKKKLNLDISFYCPELHTEHHWRCSYNLIFKNQVAPIIFKTILMFLKNLRK